MQRKFPRTFALSVVFIGVVRLMCINPANSMYQEALVEELTINKCRNLVCRLKSTGRYWNLSHNEGDAIMLCDRCQIKEEIRYNGRSKWKKPIITLISDEHGHEKVFILFKYDDCVGPMSPNEYFTYMCNKPVLKGRLKLIWDSADFNLEKPNEDGIRTTSLINWETGLESLWAAAYLLDDAETKTDGDFSSSTAEFTRNRLPEFVVETKSTSECCTII